MDLSSQTVSALRDQLKRGATLIETPIAAVKRAKRVPKSLPFGPEICFVDTKRVHLIYALASDALPKWVVEAQTQLEKFPNAHVTILAVHTPNAIGTRNANRVAEDCIRLGYGLATESDDGCFLVFPPGYSVPECPSSGTELGHVPSWLREELLGGSGLSDYLRKSIEKLDKAYEVSTQDGQISFDDECELLMGFAHNLRKGDRRLFMPVDQLAVLKEFEHAGGNPGARDHFFHTFNNLLIGFRLLNALVPTRTRSAIPDRYIAVSSGQPAPLLQLWESLWAITCLFHDPGYMGENYWSTYSVALGAQAKASSDDPIPESVVNRINNAWESEFSQARQDLGELFRRVAGVWQLAGTSPGGPSVAFDPALRRAYFDGRKCGHSLVSGLNLIKLCRGARGAHHTLYDKEKALKAAVIAALGMLFHDQHARRTMSANGIPPISFEDLPYATTLMFADALQDDRRDIAASTFPKDGVFEKITSNSGTVLATVCLPRIPPRFWAGKIAEYHSVMQWINGASDTKFHIDYRSRAGL